MLKSLKLGELGIERDPLLLPSYCRSDVLRNKVRSIVVIPKQFASAVACACLNCALTRLPAWEPGRTEGSSGHWVILTTSLHSVNIQSAHVPSRIAARAKHAP